MESMLDYVKRRLRDVGPPEWESLGVEAGATKSLPRKLVYERKAPAITTVEPLYRYFLRRDYGLQGLPHEQPPILRKR
jgi:hypothetical protein